MGPPAAADALDRRAFSGTPAEPRASQRAVGCAETAVRASCGADAVRRLYRMADAADAARADLAICEARLEDERGRLPLALEEQLVADAAREASVRRELAECRAQDRPRGVPWWVWPVVGLGAAIGGAAAWEAIR